MVYNEVSKRFQRTKKKYTSCHLSLFNVNYRNEVGGFVVCQGYVFVHWVSSRSKIRVVRNKSPKAPMRPYPTLLAPAPTKLLKLSTFFGRPWITLLHSHYAISSPQTRRGLDLTIELQSLQTNHRTCAPSENSDQSVHSHSLITINLHRTNFGYAWTQSLFIRTASLIRLCRWTGWLESSLGEHIGRYFCGFIHTVKLVYWKISKGYKRDRLNDRYNLQVTYLDFTGQLKAYGYTWSIFRHIWQGKQLMWHPVCIPAHYSPSERGYTRKGKNLLLGGVNCFLLE